MAIVKDALTTVGDAVKDRIEAVSLLPASDVFVYFAGGARKTNPYILIGVQGQHADTSTSRMQIATVTVDIYVPLNTEIDTLVDMVNKIDGDEYSSSGIPVNGLHRWTPGLVTPWTIGTLENLSMAPAFQAQPDVLQGQLVYQCTVERTR